jgi:hypothetical protein
MSSIDTKLTEYLKRHDVSVLDTNKRFARYQPTRNYFLDQKDYNIINQKVDIQTEPLYTVTIPESELKRLQEFEDQVFNNMKQTGHFNLFQTIMEQKEEEAQLRRQFPSVQKAYENYSLMLNLCKSGKN